MKILFWDLETMGLRPDWGDQILCMSCKFAGDKKVETFRGTDYGMWKKRMPSDKQMVKAMMKRLAEADVWVTWYGKKFDSPFVNSRAVIHGFKPLPPHPMIRHIDLWDVWRKTFRTSNNRLDNVSKYLNVKSRKTWIDQNEWIKARHGDPAALRYIYKHCVEDINVLQQVFDVVRPYIRILPNVNLIDGKRDACPKCGEQDTMVKRGFYYAKVTRTQRYQCSSCGGWSLGSPERQKGITIR